MPQSISPRLTPPRQINQQLPPVIQGQQRRGVVVHRRGND